MDGSDSQLVIRLGRELMTLYHLGYVAEDIAKVIVLTHDKFDGFDSLQAAGSIFSSDPIGMLRNDARFKASLNLLRIDRISEGSIEIAIAAGSLITSVVIPVLIHKTREKLKREVTFEVRSTNPAVAELIARFELGLYGAWPSSLRALMIDISRLNTNVSVTADDVYRVEALVDRYSTRLAKILKVRVE